MQALAPEPDPRRLRSTLRLRLFRHVLTRRIARSFHAVRLARPGVPDVSPTLPLIVYCNHPSWWDGALVPFLMLRLFRERRVFGPIDAQALQRYRFMRRLGFFGVQPDTFAGAATFLRVGRSVLSESDALFCLTPEGRFADVRPRPVRLRHGLTSLLARVPRVTVLPLAIEYPFWSESTPEALVRFGAPAVMGAELPAPADAVRDELTRRLTDAMDRLADDAISRDGARFDVLLSGRVGVGGVYDAWRRLDAWTRGRSFDAAHGR